MLGVLLVACGPSGITNLSIKGSDTEVNLVLELAEEFMYRNDSVSLSVTGGGSGMGIAALINGKTDLANSSRAFRPEEIELAAQQEVHPEAIVFAMDAIVIITNQDLPLNEISERDLSWVYRGLITNWSEIGGGDQKVSLYGRQSNSGTFVYFRDEVLKADYSEDVKQMNGTAQIVEAIKSDPGGIGYVGIGYVLDQEGKITDGLKILAVGEPGEAIYPTIQNITSGKYLLTRPLYQYFDNRLDGAMLDFVTFELSPAGQQIVMKNGYFPVNEEWHNYNLARIPIK